MKFLFVDDENAYEGKIAEKIAFDVMEDSGFDVQTSSRGRKKDGQFNVCYSYIG